MSSKSANEQLVELVAGLANDPLGFVRACFPWREPGQLENESGPDRWQREVLEDIGNGLLTPSEAIQIAVASGHGVGKSALVAWIILWGLTTCENTRGVVTANTETQLKTKTWPELAKWYNIFLCKHWFQLTATAIYFNDPQFEKTWRIDMVPWSDKNVEAFAGLHNKGKRIILIYDEASAIPDVIWETSEGALTDKDTQIIWAAFGNPTRNTGRFRECFGKFRHRWHTRQVDSRLARTTNKEQIARWIADYGEDSDFCRVRILGIFPQSSTMQLIPSDRIREAAARGAVCDLHDPLVLGIDVARFGSASSVIAIRKGRDARTHKMLKFSGLDTMQFSFKISEVVNRLQPDAIFIDGGGVGGGVVDRCRERGIAVVEVQFGGKPDKAQFDGEVYRVANKRTEMWMQMREWLKTGAIANDSDLINDLEGPEYVNVTRDGKDLIMLETKDAMLVRGLASPDDGDALALTFAYPVHRRYKESGDPLLAGHAIAGITRKHNMATIEYDPFAG